MPTYHITNRTTNKVELEYTNDTPLFYGRADWANPELYDHVAVADPEPPSRRYRAPMTKWAFRSLFSLEERIACDNAPENMALPVEARNALYTLRLDFEAAQEIDPSLSEVQAGVRLLETLGLIGPGRADDVLFQ